MLGFAGSVFRALTLGLFALFLLAQLPQAIERTARRVVYAVSLRATPPRDVRRLVFGPPYVDAIARIRRVIPRRGAYVLVNGGREWEGGPYWTRFELAPRRARFLGLLSELPGSEVVSGSLPTELPVVVAFSDGVPPLLLDRESFLRELDRFHDRD